MAKQNLAECLSNLAMALPESDILLLIERAAQMKKKGQHYDSHRRSEAAKKAWETRKRNIARKIANRRTVSRNRMEADAFEDAPEET